jgi:hypothetical protein
MVQDHEKMLRTKSWLFEKISKIKTALVTITYQRGKTQIKIESKIIKGT